MKNWKENLHLTPHLKAAQRQVQSLKVREVKGLAMGNILQPLHLSFKNQYVNLVQKVNKGRTRRFPLLLSNLNCLLSRKSMCQILMCP